MTVIEIFNLLRKQSNSGKLLLFVTTALKDISVSLSSVFLLKYISIIKDSLANSIRAPTFRDTFV